MWGPVRLCRGAMHGALILGRIHPAPTDAPTPHARPGRARGSLNHSVVSLSEYPLVDFVQMFKIIPGIKTGYHFLFRQNFTDGRVLAD